MDKPEPPNGKPPPVKLADDEGMSRSLRIIGIVVGLALIGGGLVTIISFGQVMNVGQLMTCVGFGIVLAVFGSRAAGQWRSWSIVGCGAIAVLLFLLLRSTPDKEMFVYGNVRGTRNLIDMDIRATESFLVGRQGANSDWQFVARKEWLRGDIFSIVATQQSGASGGIVIGCLPISLLREGLGSPDGVDLSLQPDTASQGWVLTRTNRAGSLGVFGNTTCPVKGRPALKIASLERRAIDWIIPSAMAVELQPDPRALLAQLDSSSLNVQAQGQAAITDLRKPEAIQAIATTWVAGTWSDRLDRAILVAWVAGIRQNRAVAVPLGSAFSHAQLDHIVQLTGSADRITRYNAAELLSWLLQSLAWPAPPRLEQRQLILDAALAPYQNPGEYAATTLTTSPNPGDIWYNTLIALQDAKCDMNPHDLERAASVVRSFADSEFVHSSTSFVRTSVMAKQFANSPCPQHG